METVRQILFVPPAPIVWASAGGYFENAGVEVVTTQTLSSDQIGKGLAAGEFDVGIGVMDNAIAWNDLFASDLAIIAQLERRMLMRFVAQKDITSLAEAASQPIAVDATTNGFVLVLYRALARAGIDWRSCSFDEVGGVKHRFDTMMDGRTRSTILVPPFEDMAIAKGCNALWSVDDIAPAYPGVVIAARRTFLREQSEAARRYLGALVHANAWAAKPESSEAAQAALAAARYSPKSAATLVRDSVPGLQPSIEGWEETVSLRRECGLMPQKPIGEVIDRSVLAAAKPA
jgi:ABC-type nitrate/sulfonate/bicarbonate transport system substrate-binding protein